MEWLNSWRKCAINIQWTLSHTKKVSTHVTTWVNLRNTSETRHKGHLIIWLYFYDTSRRVNTHRDRKKKAHSRGTVVGRKREQQQDGDGISIGWEYNGPSQIWPNAVDASKVTELYTSTLGHVNFPHFEREKQCKWHIGQPLLSFQTSWSAQVLSKQFMKISKFAEHCKKREA